MVTWSQLTSDVVLHLISIYEDTSLGASARERMIVEAAAAAGLNSLNYQTLARRIRAARQALRSEVSSGGTDGRAAATTNDSAQYERWIGGKSGQMLVIMHACDAHMPFHDPLALTLFCQVARAAKPHLIVVGSDMFDFYLTSRFEIVRQRADYTDELDTIEPLYNQFINALRAAVPAARLIWIYGNHERRLLRYLEQNAGQFSGRVRRDFVAMVRCGGAVWYAGETDAVRVGTHLVVEHGVRHNEHATKARLIDEGGQVSLAMGHVHRFSLYEMAGARYPVTAVTSGALCRPEPHYLPEGQTRRAGRGWTQGTVVLSTIVDTPMLSVEVVPFWRAGDSLMTIYRGREIRCEG